MTKLNEANYIAITAASGLLLPSRDYRLVKHPGMLEDKLQARAPRLNLRVVRNDDPYCDYVEVRSEVSIDGVNVGAAYRIPKDELRNDIADLAIDACVQMLTYRIVGWLQGGSGCLGTSAGSEKA